MRQCHRCKIEKDESEFNKQSSVKSGLSTWCKTCSKEYSKQFYINNTELKLEEQKEYRGYRKQILNLSDWSDIDLHEQTAFNYFYTQYKYSAKIRNFCFDLSYEQFADLVLRPCKYCACLPTPSVKSGKDVCIVNGIDRLNNSLGYTIDNCVPCCSVCNYMKKDLAIEEWNDALFRLVNNNRHLLVL